MTPFKHFMLKNRMMIGNAIANGIGILIIDTVTRVSLTPPPPEIQVLARQIDWIFTPVVYTLIFLLTLYYELPIRRYLNQRFHQQPITLQHEQTAQRRLLNEPFFLIGLDLLVWLIATGVYGGIIGHHHAGRHLLVRIIFQSLLVGIVTVTTAFFILERMLQKRLAPVLFPQGGLYATPNTVNINIRTRLAALMIACNFIPCLVMVLISRGAYYSVLPAEALVNQIREALLTNGIIFIAMGVILTLLVASNLSRPFAGIISVLKDIRRGNLDQRVTVTTNDEIGYTADVINDMAEGLREGEQLRRSLELAREVQQNLLPSEAPEILGIDVAGTSIYCDQTGGDYFDFIETSQEGTPKLSLVVGDVAGHGVSSALLMATTRAFLRLRVFLPGDPAQIISDVNAQLSRDVAASGQFMTLFYMLIDPRQRSLQWVRAGHDPAILFDPRTNRFEELRGQGIALGVDEQWQYQAQRKEGLKAGQIIVLGTDGIWESTNAAGEMFGKKALFKLIRDNAAAKAQGILNAVVDALKQFQLARPAEDDITLVVAKL